MADPPLFSRHRRAALVLWGLMAAVNLVAAIAITIWPGRSADLDTMRRWGWDWLVQGRNIYDVDRAWPEYPPHAIVMLSPLALLPNTSAVPAWASVNLALAFTVAYLAVRAVRPNLAASTTALLMLMFLCWGGFRALLQFSLLSLTFGLLSMTLAETRPILSGVCLGLALMKPQISIPFFLWALFRRQLRILGVAMAVVAAGFGLYCGRVKANPLQVIASYGEIVGRYYAGDAVMVGLAQPRRLIELATTNVEIVDAVAVGFALTTLMIVCGIGFAEAKRYRHALYAAPPLAGVWSLLTFYHLTYGFLVLLPLAALLLFDDNATTLTFRRRLFWALQLSMMADLTVLWRWFGHLVAAPASTGAVLIHVDRVIMLALFVCVLILAIRTLRTSPPSAQTAL
jgi:hypothetical protein